MSKASSLCLILLLVIPTLSFTAAQTSAPSTVTHGVWNNFDFSKSAQDWADASHNYEKKSQGLVDIVVAQANKEGLVTVPFPFQDTEYGLISYTETDLLEPYLITFDSENINVILSIQPLNVDVSRIIDILLRQYGHHTCIVGINIDLEWKTSGTINHVSNDERDRWLNEIASKNSNLKLFLTYFKNYSYFPDDNTNMVVLFDGTGDSQQNLLKLYADLAGHFNSVGIYTGYSSSSPPTASEQRILEAVPKTNYIIHTEIFSEKTTLIFEMDDVEAGWNVYTAISIADLHLKKNMPLVCGVAPAGLDDSSLAPYLPSYLKDLEKNYFDTFEIAQLGYGNNDSEALGGKSYSEQKTIIEDGLRVLNSLGIQPKTFIPPQGSADETTLQVANKLGFRNFFDFYENLNSDNIYLFTSVVSLMDPVSPGLKKPDVLMAEIDNMSGQNPIIIQFQVSDFANNTNIRLNRLSTIIDALRGSEKYLFTTAEQYVQNINTTYTPAPNGTTSIFPVWVLTAGPIVVIALIASIVYFVIIKPRTLKNRDRIQP